MRNFLILLLLTFLFSSCGNNDPRVEYDGKMLSPEKIEALGEIFETKKETQTETEAETETEEPADGIVYWTDSGAVWHERLSCGHLSDKNPIRTGSIEEALAAKKERGCSFCCE